MSFKTEYAKAEKRTQHTKRLQFARCNVRFYVRSEFSMLMVRVKCAGKRSDRSLGIKVKPGQFNHATLELIG